MKPIHKELPIYQSAKLLHAAKIIRLQTVKSDGSSNLYLELLDGSETAILVSGEYREKHKPVRGGYYIQYLRDGYESFCPAEAFEEGNELVDDRSVEIATNNTLLGMIHTFANQKPGDKSIMHNVIMSETLGLQITLEKKDFSGKPAHQTRVKVESENLIDKIEKLSKFLGSKSGAAMDADQSEMLEKQLIAMQAYFHALTDRLDSWK